MPRPRFQFSLIGLFAFTTIVAMVAGLGDTSDGLVIAAVTAIAILCTLKAARAKDD
jgi:hypothetical protein